MERGFASGSRQAPDPYDHYLENEGFYRKHTARDSSSLFRVISEQLYDTQNHYLDVRQKCVEYMRRYKYLYQKKVANDIDEYLNAMLKSKTHGTMLELQAAAHMHRRNVIIFEPFNKGNHLVRKKGFTNLFRVFCSSDNHFDSVYTTSFMENVAMCQSLTYEILYVDVFKVPDVQYAVEKMLNPSSFDTAVSRREYQGPYLKTISLKDGRSFDMSLPEDTNCILDDQTLCHFHNPDFPELHADLQNKLSQLRDDDEYEAEKIGKMLGSCLQDKYISCVAQILNERITPFPYKVAKALDFCIYRNIEFDSWSEIRKERKFQSWFPSRNNFQVGVKCLVKLRGSGNELYSGHIQCVLPDKTQCEVYIEELAEKHLVPVEKLQPLPLDQATPWALPFFYRRQMRNANMRKKFVWQNGWTNRRQGELTYVRKSDEIPKAVFSDEEFSTDKDYSVSKLKQFTALRHYKPMSYERIAAPLNIERNVSVTDVAETNTALNEDSNENCDDTPQNQSNAETSPADLDSVPNNMSNPVPQVSYGYQENFYPHPYDPGFAPMGGSYWYNGGPVPAPNWMPSQGTYMPATVPSFQYPGSPGHFYQSAPIYTVPPSSNGNRYPSQQSLVVYNSNRSTHLTGEQINYSAGTSFAPDGSDLPTDIPTLRFFYNQGIHFYRQMQGLPPEQRTNGTDHSNNAISKLALEFEANVKVENDAPNQNSNHQQIPHHNNNSGVRNDQNNSENNQNKRITFRYSNHRKNRGGYNDSWTVGGNVNNQRRSRHAKTDQNNSNYRYLYTGTSGPPPFEHESQTNPMDHHAGNLQHHQGMHQQNHSQHGSSMPLMTTNQQPYTAYMQYQPSIENEQPISSGGTMYYGIYPPHNTLPPPAPHAPMNAPNTSSYPTAYLQPPPPQLGNGTQTLPLNPAFPPPVMRPTHGYSNDSMPVLSSESAIAGNTTTHAENGHYAYMGYCYPPPNVPGNGINNAGHNPGNQL